jgi:hypothetical protein
VTERVGSEPPDPAPPPPPSFPVIALLPDEETDPATIIATCANCGAAMTERKCKLICRCGYFLSCSDYY